MARIHLLVDEAAKARYRHQAEREGKSLGAWLREAAEEKLEAVEEGRYETRADLSRFFARCDTVDQPDEPDWDEHRRVIERSRSEGLGSP